MWRKDEARAPSLPAQTESTASTPMSQNPSVEPATSVPLKSAQEARLTRSLIIEGEITGRDDLIVEGEVRGKINLPGARLTVGREGRVTADLEAREVIIHGAVTGNIKGQDRVQIAATGKAKGEISTKLICIEEGADVHGVRVNLDHRDDKKDERPRSAAPVTDAIADNKLQVPVAEKATQVHI